jgi:4-diphosphocytidyl-2-C-methyl-D-erythritol kinase
VKARAKINLALVVGPLRPDGKHEVATVLQRVELADDVDVEDSSELEVVGFTDDTIVRRALEGLATAANRHPAWRVRIEKRIPVAAGLGGGSSDAAAALRLANETLPEPQPLNGLAQRLGSDVPFFLAEGPQLGLGDGAELEPCDLPLDYTVVLLLPQGAVKESTAAVYAGFDREAGFDDRRARLFTALRERDIGAFPPNDLASSPLAEELRKAGAFRADVTGAGPALYGLFADPEQAEHAARTLGHLGRTWIVAPSW